MEIHYVRFILGEEIWAGIICTLSSTTQRINSDFDEFTIDGLVSKDQKYEHTDTWEYDNIVWSIFPQNSDSAWVETSMVRIESIWHVSRVDTAVYVPEIELQSNSMHNF